MAKVDNKAAIEHLEVIDATLEEDVWNSGSHPLDDLSSRKHLKREGAAERLAFTSQMRGIAESAQFESGKTGVDLYAQAGDRNNMATSAHVTRGRLPILDAKTVTVDSNFDNMYFDGTPEISDVRVRFTTSRLRRKFGREETTFSYANRFTGQQVEAQIAHGQGGNPSQVTERSNFRR